MNTPFLPADPPPAAPPADPASPIEAVTLEQQAADERDNFNPTHPKLYLFNEDEPRVDGLSIDPAPLPVLGTDGARGLGQR